MAQSLWNGKIALVTGGAGFLGSHVVDRAMAEGFKVVVIDNLYTGTMDNLEHHVGHPRFTFINHNVQAPFPPAVQAIKFDVIFHLACPASPVHYQNDPIGTLLTCVNGTNHALQEALRTGAPILISSTSEVYGDPLVHPQTESYVGHVSCTGIRSCYDEGKRAAEALCFDYHRRHGVKVRVARIFNTYGPRMCFNDGRIISNFVVQALQGNDITVYGTGEYTRSFQYCSDLVEGFWRLVNHPTETGPVNLGNPEEFTVLAMAHMIKDMVPGCGSAVVHKPAAQDDPKQRRPDISKALAVLGWTPSVPVAVGLQKTMEEFKARLLRHNADQLPLYVECNPLLDISTHCDKALLDAYQIPPASAILASPEQMPLYAAIKARPDVKYIPGGSGLNTARVAQWLSQAPKLSWVSYVGGVADDADGRELKQSAESDGVRMLVQYDDAAPTGTCAVCIVGKERSLVANLGAANLLKVSHLDAPHVAAAIIKSKFFYFTGFTLTLNVAHVLKVAKESHARHGTFVMNLSAPFIMQFFGGVLDQVLPYVDIIISNDDEASTFGETKGFGTKDHKEIAVKAASLPKANPAKPRLVITTCGKNPTIYATPAGAHEVSVKPIDPKLIIDTNGAGDSFVGGFLAGLSKGFSVERAIRAGNYAAGVIIQHDGCTFPATPTYDWE